MKLEWNVYEEKRNGKKIEVFNIFDHSRFYEDVKKDLKKCETKEEFANKTRSNLFYYFGSKCEWETVITSWVPRINMEELHRLNAEREKVLKEYSREPYSLCVNPEIWKKIDVYEQVHLNWHVFVDYVWSYRRSKK